MTITQHIARCLHSILTLSKKMIEHRSNFKGTDNDPQVLTAKGKSIEKTFLPISNK